MDDLDRYNHTGSGPDLTRPAEMQSIVKQYSITSQVLACGSRHRGDCNCEEFSFGQVRSVSEETVEGELLDILQSIKHDQRDIDIIMMVCGSNLEFKAIAALFPRIVGFVSYWIDVIDITIHMTGSSKTQAPSLRDTMLSMGFTHQDVQKRHKSTHSPEMDALRTISTLIELYSKPPTWQLDLHLSPTKRDSTEESRTLDHRCLCFLI